MPGVRVLVLEDEEHVRRVWVEVLKQAGYTAVGLAAAADALTRLPELGPELILLDMMMPDMNGFEFLARLRADSAWAHVPVLIVSALGDNLLAAIDRQLAEFPTLGVAGILPKPVAAETLIQRVHRIIGPGAGVGPARPGEA